MRCGCGTAPRAKIWSARSGALQSATRWSMDAHHTLTLYEPARSKGWKPPPLVGHATYRRPAEVPLPLPAGTIVSGNATGARLGRQSVWRAPVSDSNTALHIKACQGCRCHVGCTSVCNRGRRSARLVGCTEPDSLSQTRTTLTQDIVRLLGAHERVDTLGFRVRRAKLANCIKQQFDGVPVRRLTSWSTPEPMSCRDRPRE